MPATLAWKDPTLPLRVEYSPDALEKIRRLALDGLLSLPKVGLGVGGFLFGAREAGRILILDSQPIECSHALGPAFAPTSGEMEKCRISAHESAASLQIVGYYASRPRKPIEFTDNDRNLLRDLCPGAEPVALLIRPSATEESRGGLFYRKPDGTMAGGKALSLENFELQDEEIAHGIAKMAQPALDKVPPAPVVPPLVPAEPAIVGEPLLPPEKARLFGEPPPVTMPQFLTVAPNRKLPWQVIAPSLLVALILIVGFLTRDLWTPRPPLEVRTAEINGHFSIEWNRAAVRGLDSALLTIEDGKSTKAIPLDESRLLAGTLPYSRQSAEVTVTLTAGNARASAKFADPAAAAVPVPTPLVPIPERMPPEVAAPAKALPSHP